MKSLLKKEFYFQLVLHIIVFVFYSVDRDQPKITFVNAIFFVNYTIAVAVINYLFLPRYFYKKKYVTFFILFAVIVLVVMAIEEGVLEQIFFADTRGRGFGGWIYTLLQILPVIIILTGGKFAWDALVKQRQVDNLKTAVQESELLFLKSQVNPHFLFNNLNNLYSHALENSPKTPSIILELSSVLRYMLYECREKYVPLSKEIKQLENFVKLNKLQIEDRGKINFSAPSLNDGFMIAPLILVVFIENAFKHSMATLSANIKIDIDMDISDQGELHFRCKNSFQAISNNEKVSHGIGLENVRKRLELLYPGSYKLNIRESESEYAVDLRINLKKEESELYNH